ncbi:hypothetical protein [Archangium primigenium]|uniref:hypothetical protein n=1 Tax=[Archangium] primigenium TaxID=2792470 RepID=UPI00195F10DA|nr:hypothetical protein [Archangium primigenium]MBM7117770.1 hypothetical protein [Archangium primigenium]
MPVHPHLAAAVAFTWLGLLFAGSAHAGTRAPPTTTDTGQVWDLVTEFMFNTGHAFQSGGSDQVLQEDFLVPAPVNAFYYLKQRDRTVWERYRISADKIALERDTSAPPGSPGDSYDASPYGALYYPRVWKVGQELPFNATARYFDKSTCRYKDAIPWAHGRHFLRYQGPINVGGSLSVIDVVIIDRYHWLSDDRNRPEFFNPVEAERFWYARGRGWIRWDHFKDRTVGQWNSSDPAVMLKLGKELEPHNVQRVWFKDNSPANDGKTPQAVCPNGVR